MQGCPRHNARRNPCPPHEESDAFCYSCGRELSVVASDVQVVYTEPVAGGAVSQTATGVKVGSLTEKAEIKPPFPSIDNVRQFVPDKCPSCDADHTEFDGDGYCTRCWVQVLRPRRDDFIIELGAKLLARSNLGKTHERNEDYAALDFVEVDGGRVIWFVVADGLSTCQNPQDASVEACRAASDFLRQAALNGQSGSEDLMRKAVDAAQAAVVAVRPELNADPTYSPPATTVVLAYIKDGEATIGWCGDSRIYAVYRSGAEPDAFVDKLLTRDHTLLNEKIDQDGISLADAFTQFSVQELHTMVQCLGEVPEGESFAPSFARIKIEPDLACLFGCSDGAWNDVHPMNADQSTVFARMFKETAGDARAFANEVLDHASGADNNTIAVVVF